MNNESPKPAIEEYEALAKAYRTYVQLRGSLSAIGRQVGDNAYFNSTYIPSTFLFELIQEYEKIATSSSYRKQISAREKGILLEQIIQEVFESLQIAPIVESWTSLSEQIDLVLSSEDQVLWDMFCFSLGLDSKKNHKIIAEAKNWGQKVDSAVMRSFSHIIEFKYDQQCSIGIIFARSGATGFDVLYPKLKDARAVQIIFHAATSKYVVVFNHTDIMSLTKNGEFLRQLKAKIEDVEDIITDHRDTTLSSGISSKITLKPAYLKVKRVRTKLP